MLGIYCRISKEKDQGKDRSIDDQRLSGIELANQLCINYEVYIDEGLSGTLPIEHRPSLSKLIDDIYDGKISCVYVYDQSRLERSPEARFVLNKVFKDEKIKLYTDNGLIGTDIESEFQGDLLSIINNFYVKLTAKKVRSALRRNLANGKVHAITPYGYKKDNNNVMVVDEIQAVIVKRIYTLSLSGIGTNKIAEILNAENVPTKYNLFEKGGTISVKNKYTKKVTIRNKSDVKWNGGTIRYIITNMTYMGIRLFSGVQYSCPAIFDKQYWQKANDNLKNNTNNSGISTEHKYLLKGLVRCGRCGRNYYGRTRVSKKDNYYMCSSKRKKETNCGNRSLNIEILDDIIWSKFIGEGKLVKLIELHYSNINSNDIIDELEKEIKFLNGQIKTNDINKNKLIDLVLNGVLNNEEVKSKMNSLRIEKEMFEIKLYNLKDQLDSFKEDSNSITSILKELDFNGRNVSFNDRKEILNKYIKDIKIYYDDVKTYYLEIFFNIINMDNVVYTIENNYKYAYPILDIHKEGQQEMLLIILDKKLQLDYKKGNRIPINIIVDSKQQFEALKLKLY